MVKANEPLVSVVIPCLNRASFLVPTIESVLQQDYPHIECIVVDGGSTDGTIEILQSYGDRIQWVSEPDNGHADAINKGWRMSQGEILAWLNADDVWVVPDAVRETVAYLQAHPEVDVAYGDCGSIDGEGNVVGMSYLHEWNLEYAVEFCDHCIPQPAAFIRRRILEKVGWLDTDFYQKKDHELWLRIGLVGKIQHFPIMLAHARNIKGLSFEGKTAAAACIQLTKKFFTLPNIPEGLKRKRRRAMSNSYIRGVSYAFKGGRPWRLILAYALRAIINDPSNISNFLWHFVAIPVRTVISRVSALEWVLQQLKFLWGAVQEAKKGLRLLRPVRLPNLAGDRNIEWSWVASQMPSGPGEALDFGPGGSFLGLIAAQRGFKVTAVDLEPVQWHYMHQGLQFIHGDILQLSLPTNHFDLVINCSTVEHVGLAGRYSVTENSPDGDLKAMARLRELMKPGGVMLLVIPMGQDAIFPPMCRVYGAQRLPRLLEGYSIEKEAFWIKDNQNRWVLARRETALNFKASAGSWNALRNVYALGCFVLRHPGQEK